MDLYCMQICYQNKENHYAWLSDVYWYFHLDTLIICILCTLRSEQNIPYNHDFWYDRFFSCFSMYRSFQSALRAEQTNFTKISSSINRPVTKEHPFMRSNHFLLCLRDDERDLIIVRPIFFIKKFLDFGPQPGRSEESTFRITQ